MRTAPRPSVSPAGRTCDRGSSSGSPPSSSRRRRRYVAGQRFARLADALNRAPRLMRPDLGSVASWPIHPFLFASLFVVYLLAENLDDQVKLADVLFVLVTVVAATAAALLLLWLVSRNAHLAAAITTVLV